MKHRLLAVAAGAALVAGLVTATTADAHTRSARSTLATADGTRIGSVEFGTDDGHTLGLPNHAETSPSICVNG